MKKISDLDQNLVSLFRRGTVIPAMPLALDEKRCFAPVYQRALCRYYMEAGVGGIAVGVHSTQFAIRNPEIGLFEPVMRETSRFIDQWSGKTGKKILKIGGVCGKTVQAAAEAEFEVANGYDAALLSLGAFKDASPAEMLEHCKTIAGIMPIIGFYLQPSVGGRILPFEFWREFMKIENVLGVKIAPFNRYCTLDVVRAATESGRDDITLYTGNDDNILIDLLTGFDFGGNQKRRIRGGLLGHWCCWTKKAVEVLDKVHNIVENNLPVTPEILTLAAQITDCNAAFFDPQHNFAGCIPGIHEVLHRQGLLPGILCLDPEETLSPGQSEEITRVHDAYPHLHDDGFVSANLKCFMED